MRRIGVANSITLARILLIPVFLVFLLAQLPNWGPVWAAGIFTLLAITDALDGWVARTRGEVTTFGKFIDPLADKLLVTAALVALVQLGRLPGWIAIIIIARELIISGLRMVAVAEGHVISASPYGKAKTVFQIIAIVAFMLTTSPGGAAAGGTPLVLTWFGEVGAYWLVIASWVVMGVALALTLISAIDYFLVAGEVIEGPWSPHPGPSAEQDSGESDPASDPGDAQ